MLELAKRSHWLQTLVVKIIAAVPPAVEHNVQKTLAIKKALYFAYLEQIEGDYLEFGTYEGTSLIAAFEQDRRFREATTPRRAFWGFDSFEGFKYFDRRDHHPFFKEGHFASNFQQVQRRIKNHFKGRADWTLVKGYFEETIQTKTTRDLGIDKISVALVDCDLGSPALIALNFMLPALQNGTVLILDDYFAYRGSPNEGVAGAFQQFRQTHPHLIFRRLFDYGHGGRGFVLAGGAEET